MPSHAHAEPPIPFVTVTNWVRAARRCGIDIEAIFGAEGLDGAQLHPATATVSRELMQRIMNRCVDDTIRVGSPLPFPIALGETFAFEYLADVDTFITTSATLRDAARALAWIPPLVNPYLRFELTEHGSEARISLHHEVDDIPLDRAWAFTEAAFTTVIKFSRLLMGSQPLIGRISLRHPRHPHSDAFEAHHQVPVEHQAPLDALWFDRILLDRPLQGAFPTLHEIAAQRVIEQVAQRQVQQAREGQSSPPLIDQIERAFLAKPRLMGLGLGALAEELALHERTLQRRLKELGDSHSAIQGRVRYRLARQFLLDTELPIEDISERLGFADRRSFTQAFTRWSGHTPSQFRRQTAP